MNIRTQMNYRGYTIERNKLGWTVRFEGELMTSQPSEDFARIWIDREIKRIRDHDYSTQPLKV
jgi:hypothetical protein